jgi:DNA-binding response OmpR family regulator
MEKKAKIAIVDDHIQTAVSISEALEYNGFDTIQAYTGKDAVKLCKAEKPDLLLLDIKMEDKDGYEVAKELPGQKIIFITGYELNGQKKTRNVVGILTKPIDIDKLIELVKKKL